MSDVDALDTFLESDIARYLENRLAPPEDKGRPDLAASVVFLTRDYERELNEALDHDEIARAKHILHDLKERFDEAPDGTAEKNQIKTLLIGLYERFRMRLEHDDDQDRTDVDLSRLMRSWGIQPIEPTTPEPPAPVFEEPRPARSRAAQPTTPRAPVATAPIAPEAPAPEIRQSAQERDQLIAQVNVLLEHVQDLLAKGDLKGAAHTYRETRRDVLAFDGGVPESLADNFLAVYAKIRSAIDTRRQQTAPHVTRSPSPAEAKPSSRALPLPPSPGATPGSDPAFFDRAILAGIAERKRELDAAVARHDLASAARTYSAIRAAAMHIRDARLREATARKLKLLHALLTRLKGQHHAHDKHLTGGRP